MMMSSLVVKKTLMISRFAENDLPEPGVPKKQAVWIFQQFAVCHNEVIAESIQAIIKSFTTLEKLTGSKRYENRCAGSG